MNLAIQAAPATLPPNGMPFKPYRYRGSNTDTLTPAEFQAELDRLDPDLPDKPYTTRARKPCGTPAAYRRHKRRGEEACQPCLEAERRRWDDHAATLEPTRQERYRLARAAGMNRKDALAARSRRAS